MLDLKRRGLLDDARGLKKDRDAHPRQDADLRSGRGVGHLERRQLFEENAVGLLERIEGRYRRDAQRPLFVGRDGQDRGEQNNVPGRLQRHLFLGGLVPGRDRHLKTQRLLAFVLQREERSGIRTGEDEPHRSDFVGARP